MRYRQARSDILDLDGVVSVSKAEQNGRMVMIVGVEDRSVARILDIPGNIDGLPVVVEVSDRAGLSGAINPLVGQGRPPEDLPEPVSAGTVRRTRPLPPGVSIGHRDVSAGTASFLAKKGGDIVQLSNNHVLALYGDADIGDGIVQPGPADGGSVEEDRVGVLNGAVPVSAQGDNNVDIAWYSPEVEVTEEIQSVGTPNQGVRDPSIGDTIRFAGRTSGVEEAQVDRVEASIELQSGIRFVDQFRIDIPFRGGDSGSPIVTTDGTPAGVAFASTGTRGWANYASNIAAEAGVDILPAGFLSQRQVAGIAAGGLGVTILAEKFLA